MTMQRMMNLQDVCNYARIGKTKMYEEMNKGHFPQSVKLLGNVRWDKKEIDEFLDEGIRLHREKQVI